MSDSGHWAGYRYINVTKTILVNALSFNYGRWRTVCRVNYTMDLSV